VLSGRGLGDELSIRPEKSYRLWWVVVCDLENLKNEEAMTRVGSQSPKKKVFHITFQRLNGSRLKLVFVFSSYCLLLARTKILLLHVTAYPRLIDANDCPKQNAGYFLWNSNGLPSAN
jgi:hypothetical protein